MRISTAVLSTLVAAGSISASMQYALVQQSAEPALPLGDIPLAAPASQPADQTTSEPTTSATAAEPSAPTTETATSEPTSAAPTAPAADASPAAPDAPAATQAPQQTVAPAPEPVVTTVTSDVIEYKYGAVQISLTATDGAITNVSLLQGDASYGRDAAYAALIDATIAAQGTNYGNYSGATFTTDAFKKAVTNAIGKL